MFFETRNKYVEWFIWSVFFFMMCVGVPFLIVTKGNVTNKTIQKTMVKYGCTPTNEFVGKNADRLYVCRDGLKQKYETIRQWAFQEKEKWND